MTNGSKYSSSGQIRLWLRDGNIAISHNMKINPTTLYRSADAYIFKLYAAGTKVVGLESYDPEDHEDDLRIHDGEGYCSC